MYWNYISRKTEVELFWLTLTWDVLKLPTDNRQLSARHRLTLTWDVLKYHTLKCKAFLNTWLTLTWDVLKYG